MSLLRIRYLGDPVLRTKAEPVTDITDELRRLAEDMIETMVEKPGLGLAAPQVGQSIRMSVVRLLAEEDDAEDEEKEVPVVVLVNPELVERSTEKVTRREGCLSLPTLYGDVERSAEVLVRAFTLEGEPLEIRGKGLMARVLQHELDHLDGVVFLDRADPDTLVWLVPDEREEAGYCEVPTTVEEVVARFEEIAARRGHRKERAES
jgi:peptide deformylase